MVGSSLVLSGIATAATTGSSGSPPTTLPKSTVKPTATGAAGAAAKFAAAKQALEVGAAQRQGQLVKLTASVNASTSLFAGDKATLAARLASATAIVNGIVAHIPSDTTYTSLDADSASLYKDNRVYAVMTPQVGDTTWADSLLARLAAQQAELAKLSGGTAPIGALITSTTSSVTRTRTTVLAQTPTAYPGDASLFSDAQTSLRAAQAAANQIDQQEHALVVAARVPKTTTTTVAPTATTVGPTTTTAAPGVTTTTAPRATTTT